MYLKGLQTIVAFTCLMFFIYACQEEPKNESKVEGQQEVHPIESEHPEEEHYLLPGLDHGLLQSPINILSADASVAGKHHVTLNFNGHIEKVRNLGHTVQLDFEPGNTISAEGKTYEFKQLHFHTPSEHLIDGITYPMEMHVVNVRAGKNESDNPEYLVVSFLIKMGEESEFINTFIEEIPEGENETTDLDLNAFKYSELLMGSEGELLNNCYQYMGSLTTPPYTESVYWLVVKRIFEASPEQIMKINELEGDNARHIQGKYKRDVYSE